MLEFAHAQWLWLFLLLVLFYLGWVLARRYRRRRVTYAMVWQRVAKRVLPPAWKRILRTVLTLLIATAMLGAVALYATGLQRPTTDAPAPMICVVVIENSVRARAAPEHSIPADLLAALGDDDRAIFVWFREGQPVLSAWHDRESAPPAHPPTDFVTPDLQALARAFTALAPPPDMPALPEPRRMLVWVGDSAPAELNDLPLVVHTTGTPADNDYITAAEYTPPAPGDPHGGVVVAEARSGPPRVTVTEDDTRVLDVTSRRVELPISSRGLTVRVSTPAPDGMPDDDRVEFRVGPRGLAGAVLCYPADDGEPNPLLVEVLHGLLPGREVQTLAIEAGDARVVEADLVVCDRVVPAGLNARAVMCFGVIPPARGRTGAPVVAEPNLRAPVPDANAGFDVPDLALLSAEHAVPLVDYRDVEVLTRNISGDVLIAVAPDLLYCGFIPHLSTLFQDPGGLLLLLRWIESVQHAEPAIAPLLARAGDSIELRLDSPAEVRLEPARWQGSYRPAGFDITPGPDGLTTLELPRVPGRWRVSRGGAVLAEIEAVWAVEALQDFRPVEASQPQLATLFAHEQESDWRDLLPGLLLWIALGLITLEWLLWLTGVTD